MASLLISIRASLIEEFKNLGAFNLVTVTKDPNSVDNNNLMGTNGDTSEGKLITDTTLASMKKLSNVVAATPILSVNFSTMHPEEVDKKTWASVVAYDPSTDVFDIPLVAGRKITSSDMDKIVVGTRYLQDFNLQGKEKEIIGKRVVFNSKMGGSPASGIDWGPAPSKPPVNADESYWKGDGSNKGIDVYAEIVGVADNGTVGDGQNYINLAWARRLNTQVRWEPPKCQKNEDCQQNTYVLVKDNNFASQGYTSIVLKVNDTENIKSVADLVSQQGYGAVTAQQMLDQINNIMKMISIVLGIIAGISLFVAAIGIINTMMMATYERTREIGVMRACGATKGTIRRLFTIEAASLGFWGGAFGLIISIALIQIAKVIVAKSADLGNLPLDQIGNFPVWLIVSVIAFTSLIGLISGLVPAIKASRLNPVDSLRYE
jgi:putative ABC transport system permease protein